MRGFQRAARRLDELVAEEPVPGSARLTPVLLEELLSQLAVDGYVPSHHVTRHVVVGVELRVLVH